jgi:hypothetical protein
VCRCPSNLLHPNVVLHRTAMKYRTKDLLDGQQHAASAPGASGAARTQAAIDMDRSTNRSALRSAHLGQYLRSIKAKLWSRDCGYQLSIVEVIILCTISIGLSLGHSVTLGELDI